VMCCPRAEEEEEDTATEVEEEDGRTRQERELEIAARLGIHSSTVSAGLVSSVVIPSAHVSSAAAVGAGAAGGGGEALEASSAGEGEEGGSVAPPMPLDEFKRRSEALVREFLSSEEFGEAEASVRELGAPFFRYELVKRVLLVAADLQDRERELASRLLSHLYGRGVLNMESMAKGYERVFENASELRIDIVDLDRVMGTFLARSVADEELPPAFITDAVVAAMGGAIVDTARALLSQPHALQRLENCWGPTAVADIPALKHAVRLAVDEFFDTRDAAELQRCLGELRAPHFLHEAAKRIVVAALDKPEEPRAAALALLSRLSACGVLSESNLVLGFRRVREDLPDIELDNPAARPAFDSFVRAALDAGLLPAGVDLTPRYS
jgi:MA3 domain